MCDVKEKGVRKGSVIIPTYNRGDNIIHTLNALTHQSISFDRFEVIIVEDGSSTDVTRVTVQKFIDAHPSYDITLLCHKQNFGRGAACNSGIKMAKYPLILFTDDDCVPYEDWIAAHFERHLRESDPVAVLGAVSFPEEWVKKSNFIRYENARYIGNRRGNSVVGSFGDLSPRYFGGLNISIPKDQLLAVGLFDEKIGRGQDVELGYRLWKAGLSLVFEPQAHVIHCDPEVLDIEKRFSKRSRAYKDSICYIQSKHPDFVDEVGNWFLEAPHWGKDSFGRLLTKFIVRLLVNNLFAKVLLAAVTKVDGLSCFYTPFVFQYIFAAAALSNVRLREKSIDRALK